nr:mat [Porphyropsis coccinea]
MLTSPENDYLKNVLETHSSRASVSLKKIDMFVKEEQRNIYKASIVGDSELILFYQNRLINNEQTVFLAAYKAVKLYSGHKIQLLSRNSNFIDSRNNEVAYLNSINRFLQNESLEIKYCALEILLSMVLQPEWEARIEPNSYFDSTVYSVHQAIIKTYSILSQNFDYENACILVGEVHNWYKNVDIEFILKKTVYNKTFKESLLYLFQLLPLHSSVKLLYDKFQFLEIINFSYNTISSLLAKIIFYGFEMSLLWNFKRTILTSFGIHNPNLPSLTAVTYSNHFLIIFSSKNLKIITFAINFLESFFSSINQTVNFSSLSTSSIHDGFDFLGFNFKKYNNNRAWNHENSKLLIQPTKDNIKKHLLSIRKCLYHKDRLNRWRANSHMTQSDVIYKLNPLIKTFTEYYSCLVVPLTMKNIDTTLNEIIYRYAIKKYKSNKYQKWIKNWTAIVNGKKVVGYKSYRSSGSILLFLHHKTHFS